MLPVDPQTLESYHPDQIRKDAERYGESEIRAGADRLIAGTPGGQEMKDNAEFVDDNFLKGLKPLSLSDIQDLSLADAEEITEQIIVNVANYYGIPITSLNPEEWAQQSLTYFQEELRRRGEEYVATAVTEAMAQYGMQSASTFASHVLPWVGLATTSYQALEDGHLSQGEAMTISTSAMTTASTVFAGSAVAVGFGIVGAVFAPAALGTAWFEGVNAAEEEYRRQVREAVREQVSQEEAGVNTYLQDMESKAHLIEDMLWDRRDHSISSVANDWALLEHKLGASFQLRFFPGAPPPLRGGWYYPQVITGGGSFLKKQECNNLAGCLYFPGSDSFLPWADTARFLLEMRKVGQVVSGTSSIVDPKYYALSPYQFDQTAEVYGGSQYSYYWRTLRAFDALVPERRDSKGSSTGFWVHPGHEFRQKKPFKDYGLLAWDVYCRKDPYCVQACPWNAPCSDYTKRNVGRGKVQQSYFSAQMSGTPPWDMAKEASEYVLEIFDRLQEDSDAIDTYRTRLQGDLLQTAGAVRGEREAARQLAELAKKIGFRPNVQVLSSLDKAEKRDIKVIDDQTREVLGKLDARNKRTNTGLMFAGGAVLAAGVGTWYAKGRR